MKRYSHLSSDERVLIGHYRDCALSKSAIAHLIGRSKSTINRELARHTIKAEYSPQKAQDR